MEAEARLLQARDAAAVADKAFMAVMAEDIDAKAVPLDAELNSPSPERVENLPPRCRGFD